MSIRSSIGVAIGGGSISNVTSSSIAAMYVLLVNRQFCWLHTHAGDIVSMKVGDVSNDSVAKVSTAESLPRIYKFAIFVEVTCW